MRKASIRFKLFLTTMSILILTVAITSHINIIRFRAMYREALLERARADAHDIRKGLDQGLAYFPLDSFSDMTVFLKRHLHESFSYAYVADKDLDILYHTDPQAVGKSLKGEPFSRLDFGGDIKSNIVSTGRFYEMVIPVIKDFELVGTVHVGIENDLVDSRVRAMIAQNMVILLFAMILSVSILYALLVKNITDPISRLADKVKEMSGNLNLVLRESDNETGDEVKEFALMFDTMAEEIRRKTDRLQEDIEHRKTAENKLKKSYEELRVTFEGSIRALSAAIEIRDPYTSGHQQRVAQLACSIATEMDMPASKIREIHLSAMSHDIGKIGVPSSILTKKGRLSDEEYNLIQSHPQVGYDILKEIEFPWPIATIVRQHHERLDGTGYPLGIKENDILPEARIIAVSDVVEAIISARPYREALGKEAAIEEITRFRGVKYDPVVVDICVDLFLEKKFEFSITQEIVRPG